MHVIVCAVHILFISYSFSLCEERAMRRIQIGVKRRVENCRVKTRKGDLLHVHYQATLDNDYMFDSSNRAGQPFTFTLGSEQVIRGWDQGLMGMCIGEKRKLVIPPEYAYGNVGVPPKVPPDATVTFLVEVVDIERRHEF